MNKQVLIFRDMLLPYSETFITEQARYLRNYEACFLGSRQVPGGLPIPDKTTVLWKHQDMFSRLSEAAFKLLGYSPKALHLLRQLRPDLIHAHFGPDGLTIMPLAEKLNIPLLVTLHGYEITVKAEAIRHFRHRQFHNHWRTMDRMGVQFIAVSKFLKQSMIETGFKAHKIIQHYIGVDVQRFTPSPNDPRRYRVVFVGRLVEQKGCELLIRAFRKVRDAIPQASLVIIGDGPLRSHLESLAAELIPGRYSFMGATVHSVVVEEISKANVLCVPSITDETGAAEGLGMVFLEAAALERSVVSFPSGGIPEVVRPGFNGLLAPERDYETLADHLIAVLRDGDLQQMFGRNGREMVLQEFDLRTQTAKLEAIYDSVALRGAR